MPAVAAQPSESTDSPTIPGLEADAEGARIVAEELKLLATVQKAIDAAIEGREGAQKAVKENDDSRLLELREDISVAKPEDLAALFEQMHNLGALRAQRGKSAIGVLDRGSPYFGHLRLEETFAGEKKARRRDVLVGGQSYIDSAAGIRIVDWRNAPVSRIYYRYREDDDYEEVLGAKPVEGKVMARRSVAIVGGQLRRVSCPQGTFIRGADGHWKRVDSEVARLVWKKGEAKLGVGADGEIRKDKLLPAIAALLDPAQYDIVTRPSAGVVPIQGSAGSGKTTVGLHRVAYLHASDPKRFRPDRMLVIVPNEALIHYTARVLPSLGVDGVPVMTFTKWAVRVTLDLFPRLPSRVSEDTPPVVSRIKTHPRMLGVLEDLAAKIGTEVDTILRSSMAKWPDGAKVIAAWDKTEGAPDERVTELSRWLVGKTRIGGTTGEKLPNVTQSAATSAGAEMRKKSRGVLELWDEACTDKDRLARAFDGVPNFGPGRLGQMHDWCVRQARIRSEGERDGESPTLDSEDYALILRAFQVLRGPLVDIDAIPLRTAHLFVDEVQDSNAVELKVLLGISGKEPSVTLSGDVAQRMLSDDDDGGEFSWNDLLEAIGVARPNEEEGQSLEPLRVSYRSTAQITGFARAVLGPYAHQAEPIAEKHGPPVELFPYASVGEAVAFLADALKELHASEPTAHVAVLARFPQQADAYAEGLERAEVPGVRRVRKQDFTWEAGVDVTDVRATKGLEFDEVVLVDANHASYPETAQARHALYVGATRAAHQLWCVSSDTPAKIVQEGLAAAEAGTATSAAP